MFRHIILLTGHLGNENLPHKANIPFLLNGLKVNRSNGCQMNEDKGIQLELYKSKLVKSDKNDI